MFKWIKDAKRVREMEAEVKAAKAEAGISSAAAYNAEAEMARARQDLQVAKAKTAELEKKVREQNEADLLLVSIQIVQRITAGEKKESPALQSLLQQQASLQNIYPYGAYNSGLGAMNVFGAALGGLWRQ